MSYVTKSEFARLAGRENSRWLYPYVKKGHVVLNGDFVDVTHPVNVVFLNRWKQRPVKKMSKFKKFDETPSVPEKQPEPNIKPFSKEAKEIDTSVFDREDELRELELKKKKVDLELSEEKLRKVKGEVVPVDLVKSLFQQFGKSSTAAFSTAADNLMMKFQKRLNISRDDMANMREELIESTNEAIDEAADDSIKSLKTIVSEYSQKRGIGERT